MKKYRSDWQLKLCKGREKIIQVRSQAVAQTQYGEMFPITHPLTTLGYSQVTVFVYSTMNVSAKQLYYILVRKG